MAFKFQFKHIESALLGLLGLSLLTSKAGINIFSIALLLLFIIKLVVKAQYREELKTDSLGKLCLAVYIIGVLSTVIYPGTLEDTIYFARKGVFLLLIPILIKLNTNKINRMISVGSVMVGLVIAVANSYLKLAAIGIANWDGQRIDSFWDVGRWGEALTYCVVFIIPLIFNGKNGVKQKIAYALITLMAISAILLSGSRAAIGSVIVISLLTVLIFQKKYLIHLLLIISLGMLSLSFIYPKQVHAISSRITSITDTNELSNMSRISMWNHGLKFAHQKLNNQFIAFMFGSGPLNFPKDYSLYLESSGQDALATGHSQLHYSVTDSHNAFIDTFTKYGMVFFIGLMSLFIVWLKVIYQSPNTYSTSSLNVILAFLFIGMVYTNQTDIQTIIAVFLMAVGTPKHSET
ncbi:putative O antigen ligase [Photobacterium marinum]|uniref:Putative O antigen ligase n=1 Tax=Photobacterium marinum TaxID=1056511 RepID=L8J538_9GAMM|nr:O-antigen ligase family protein [Photobacterium marinum]ELR63995.1 putative O antigen ligase [Photobacterium marinum]